MSINYYKQTEKGFEVISLYDYVQLENWRVATLKERQEYEKQRRKKDMEGIV